MDANTGISRVAIVGTGLIGGSWAACFLAHGLDGVATDPAPGTEDKMRQYVEAAWAALTKIGLAPGVSVADADAAVCMGPGLRWALMGPNLIYHLGGGPGGMHHFLKQFTSPMTACWADLGSPDLASPELQKKIVDGVLEEVDGRSFEELSHERDTLIMGLLELLSHRGKAKPVAARGHTADDS